MAAHIRYRIRNLVSDYDKSDEKAGPPRDANTLPIFDALVAQKKETGDEKD